MDHKSASFFSRYLAGLLALSLAIQPSLTYAGPNNKKSYVRHTPVFEGQAFEGVDYFARPSEAANDEEWSEFLKSELANREKTNLEKIKESGDDLVQLMLDYKEFFAYGLNRIDEMSARFGYEKVFEKLDAGKLKIQDKSEKDLGTMEFTNIDGDPVAKITHKKSGVAFVIYDEERTDKGGGHFQKYLARQHYDPGSNKARKYIGADGKTKRIRYGRDVIAMGIRGDLSTPSETTAETVEVAPRKRGLKHWWKATYQKPDKKQVILGTLSGLAQFVSVGAIAQAVAWVLPGYEPGNAPAMIASFTLAYGTLFGIWNSFYQNWRSRGPKWVRDIKNMSVSVGYYFGVYVLSQGLLQQVTVTDMSLDPSQVVAFAQEALSRVTEVDPGVIAEKLKAGIEKVQNMKPLAIVAALHFFHNFWANNEFKNIGYWLQKIEELERTDLHNVSVPIPLAVKDDVSGFRKMGVKWVETPMPRRYWNRQFLYYLPVNWAKFLDQVWFSWTIGPALAGDYPQWVPLLSIAGFWVWIHAHYRWINWWAYKGKHKDVAEKLHIREESKAYLFFDDIIKSSWNNTKNSLNKLKSIFTRGDIGKETELLNVENVPDSTPEPVNTECEKLLVQSNQDAR